VFPAGRGDARDVELAVEGVLLGRYKFDRYLTSDESKHPDVLESVTLAASHELGAVAFDAATRRAEVVAEAAARAPDRVTEPAAEMTPTKLAAVAAELARDRGLDVEILDGARCRELGMGMFLAVAQGSDEEPRFIHLTYKPKTAAATKIKKVV